MKTCVSISMVLLFCFLINNSISIALEASKTNEISKANQREDIIAQEFNFDPQNDIPKGAISYGLASNSGYLPPPDADSHYLTPTVVTKLPDKMDPPAPGPTENVDEIATTQDYYDGSSKLNTIKIKCISYSTPTECFNQSSCGWCGSSNSCILGNNMGPLQACLKSSYVFSSPLPNFNKRTGDVSSKVSGINVTVVKK